MSILDMIGPVMIGPSSSHTAGACRLGLLARAILHARPERAALTLHGSFAKTGRGHGTDRALVAGLLGMRPDEARLPDALGAPDRRVLGLVLGESVLLTGCGVLLGLAGGVGAGRLMRGLLYGIDAGDPFALGAAAVVVLQVGLLAAALPAVRAARIDPGVALRAE